MTGCLTIQIREIHVQGGPSGFQVESLVVVTTLIDAASTQDDIAELYGHRWLAELDIRDQDHDGHGCYAANAADGSRKCGRAFWLTT
jgi:hypothetical protein